MFHTGVKVAEHTDSILWKKKAETFYTINLANLSIELNCEN